MVGLAGFRCGDHRGGAPSGGNPQHARGRAGKQDHAIAVPVTGDKAVPGYVAQGLGEPASNVDLAELTARLKCEEPAVGSPEWVFAVLGAGQYCGPERIERTNPKLSAAVRVGSAEDQLAAIRR